MIDSYKAIYQVLYHLGAKYNFSCTNFVNLYKNIDWIISLMI